MKIKTIATGSSGNCYYIENNNEILLLDAGIPIMDIKRGVDFRVGDIVGCIVSHEHKDHSLSVSKIANMGIRVYRPYSIEDKKILKTRIGSFNITSFDVPHNGTENRGFLINVGGKTILYITDAEYVPYIFKEIDIMLIECNYDKRLIDNNSPNYNHSVLGHMELQTCIDFISQYAASNLSTVVLIHMSKDNLDIKKAQCEIDKIKNPRLNILFAKKGLEIEVKE